MIPFESTLSFNFLRDLLHPFNESIISQIGE